eukprot:7390695-Prymnesium_polylepis.2
MAGAARVPLQRAPRAHRPLLGPLLPDPRLSRRRQQVPGGPRRPRARVRARPHRAAQLTAAQLHLARDNDGLRRACAAAAPLRWQGLEAP